MPNSTVLMNTLSSEKISWENEFDLVVTGDSRTLIDISPESMQKILPNYKIGNLGFAALIYSQDYMDYTRNTLRSPVRNKIIIVGFSPRSLLLNEKSGCYFHNWKKEARLQLKIEVNRLARWLQNLFRELSEDDLNSWFFKTYHRHLIICLKSGWMPARLFPENVMASKKQYINHFLKNKIDTELLEMIYRNTRKWSQEGIKVFGIRLPTSPNLIVVEKKLSNFDEQDIQQRFEDSGGIWLNPAVRNLVSHDGSHLRYDSAVQYSISLAQVLKKAMGEKP